MVSSRKIVSVAAAIVMSTASAFSPTSLSFGTQSGRISPLSLQVVSTVTDAPSSPVSSSQGLVLDRPKTIKRRKQDEKNSVDTNMFPNGESILRIYNDNINTREYIAVCLVQVVGLCESRAYFTMQDAHQNGIAKVGEYNHEVAECYEDQLNERGVMCDVISAGGE